MPSHGKGVTASGQPFSEYKKKPGERTGHNWRIPNVIGKRAVRHVLFDANSWKSFVYARLAVPMGGKGSLSLFGSQGDTHRMLADHLSAEVRDRHTSETTGRTTDVWTAKIGRPDNHLLDCMVGAAVAASIQGVTLPEGQAAGSGKPVKRINIAEMQRQAQAKRG
jgi:phage terminase large subunit GpA-like protein